MYNSFWVRNILSWELTHPTYGRKGKTSSQPVYRDMLYMFIHNEKSAKTNHSSLPTGHFFIPNFAFFRSGSAFTCSGRVIPGKYFTFSWDVSAQMGTQKLTPKNPTWPQKTHIKNRLNTQKQGLCSSERIDSQRIFIQVDPRIHQVYPYES